MDFGELLDQWDRLSAKPGGLEAANEAERQARELEAGEREGRLRAEALRRRDASRISLESWLDSHPVEDKDSGGSAEAADKAEENRRLAELRPGARLDLHGKTVAEAELALGIFLEDSVRRGLEKVLVITGKGNHSAEGPVLGKAVRRFLESSIHAGRFGQAEKAEGGSGALWVVIRRRGMEGRRSPSRGPISRDR